MTDGTDASKPAITAQGQNEVPLEAHYPEGQKVPDSFSGTATYTVTNNHAEEFKVLANASLEPASTAGAEGAGKVPSGASVEVTPKSIQLAGGASAQAEVDVNVPAGPEPFTGVLKFVAKHENRHNEPGFSATYTSNVRTEAGKAKGNKWLLPVLIIVVLLALAAAGFGAWKVFFSGDDVAPFAIPAVRGQAEAEAKKRLEEACTGTPPCLTVVVTPTPSPAPEVAIGNAIGTEPEASQTANEGDEVKLLIMQGFTIPEVQGLEEADAKAKLDSIDGCESPCFAVTVYKYPSLDIDAGEAISTHPDTGQQAKAKSSVALSISQGAGALTLTPGELGNLDGGFVDIQFDGGTNRMLRANNAAFVASGPTTLTWFGCRAAAQKFETTFVSVGDPNASHICVRTHDGRFVEVAVQPESTSSQLRINYKEWEPPKRFPGGVFGGKVTKAALEDLLVVTPAGP